MNGDIAPAWPLWQRLLFRWWFVYVLLFGFPFPLDSLPLSQPFEWIQHVLVGLAVWVGHHLLGLADVPVTLDTGSGDTMIGWLLALTSGLIAVLVTAVWSVAARRSEGHPRLQAWLRIYVRYLLFATMIGYGFVKVFPTQFPPPTAVRLSERIGELSPMGLLWTFMGHSVPYSVFAGIMEAGAGLLLLFRRTTLLGALLALGVLGNVVMLNMAYDVPVKLYSIHLWLLAAWLALPDAGRLVKLLLLNQPVPAVELAPPVPARWFTWARVAGKLVACWILWTTVHGQYVYYPEMLQEIASTAKVYGAWDVSGYTVNGKGVGPSGSVWQEFGVSSISDRGRIRLANDSMVAVLVEADSALTRIAIYPIDSLFRTDSNAAAILRLVARHGDSLVVQGSYRGDSLGMVLTRSSQSGFRLQRRGFRWVQEYPYNR